ncbi:tetratricopeptide repeat protein [Chitinimonas sp.]|uniref:tetratricopeptide repeat protein n=1 Tax=Chitinimonas sp. TaxID=1934313 RepID=UPI0035B1B3F1
MKLIPTLLLGCLLLSPAYAACQASNRGAAAVKKAALASDANALAALMDTEKFQDRVLADLRLNTKFRNDVAKGLDAGMSKGFSSMLKTVSASGMQLVDQKAAPGLVMLRMEGKTPGDGINYLEFELDQSGCIVDWSQLMSGSRFSALIRQVMASSIQDKTLLASLFGINEVDDALLSKFKSLVTAMQSRELKKAVAMFDELPPQLRNSFDFTIMRIGLLAQIDAQSPNYRKALEELARNHGGEARAQFMLIDHYFLTKQYDKALAAIAALQGKVGVDEENELLRGNILAEAGRGEEAVAAMRKVVALTPDRKQSYFFLLGAALVTQRYQDVVDTMDLINTRFQLSFPHKTLQADADYAGLLASQQYKAWRKKHPG